jgi:hypothetical protein
VEPYSTVKRKSQREAAKCCFSKLVVQQLKLVGPINENHFFLCYQTLKYVVAGEPHPQPHYQTASSKWISKTHLYQKRIFKVA